MEIGKTRKFSTFFFVFLWAYSIHIEKKVVRKKNLKTTTEIAQRKNHPKVHKREWKLVGKIQEDETTKFFTPLDIFGWGW